MKEIDRLVRNNIIQLKPYSSARDEFTGKDGILMDANENPFGTLNRYPDPYQKELKATISSIKGIDTKYIFLGNGSDEIIDLCFRVFCNPGTDKALIFTPTYGMYAVSAAINDIEVIGIPLKTDFQIDLKRVESVFTDNMIKLLFICSPNNPTGNCMNEEDILFIAENFKGIVVLDEAYRDFSGKPSFNKMIDRFPKLVVLQTFSKALGLAAVRIGMAFTNPDIIYYFNKLKPPYNISTINQMAAQARILMVEEYKNLVKLIKKERERLSDGLKKLKIIDMVYPSDANFLLVKVKDADAVYKTLVENGIILRNRSSVIPGCLRITIGTREDNNRLIRTLENIRI
jgi:histidinol-phosphate aminotransferase